MWTGSWCIVKEEENEQTEERRQQRKDANKKDNLIWEVWFPMIVNVRTCISDYRDQWSQPPCQDLVTAMSPSPALAGWLAGWDALPPLPRSPHSPPPPPRLSGHSQGRGWGMALSLSRPLSLTLLQVICIFEEVTMGTFTIVKIMVSWFASWLSILHLNRFSTCSCDLPHTLRCDGDLPDGEKKAEVVSLLDFLSFAKVMSSYLRRSNYQCHYFLLLVRLWRFSFQLRFLNY